MRRGPVPRRGTDRQQHSRDKPRTRPRPWHAGDFRRRIGRPVDRLRIERHRLERHRLRPAGGTQPCGLCGRIGMDHAAPVPRQPLDRQAPRRLPPLAVRTSTLKKAAIAFQLRRRCALALSPAVFCSCASTRCTSCPVMSHPGAGMLRRPSCIRRRARSNLQVIGDVHPRHDGRGLVRPGAQRRSRGASRSTAARIGAANRPSSAGRSISA